MVNVLLKKNINLIDNMNNGIICIYVYQFIRGIVNEYWYIYLNYGM